MKQVNKNVKLARPRPSHALSRFASQALEKSKYKRIFAANVALFATVLQVGTYPSHAFDYGSAPDKPLVETAQVELLTRTETAYQFPVANPMGVSQSYSKFHPAVDIRAPKGNAVLAVSGGTVIEVKHLKTGYGYYVRIAHAGTVSTLYAHLNKIDVAVGQKVDKSQTIGTVGTTGWATGPHLHFEINEGYTRMNPKLVLTI